jgi:hypothetical protein
MANNELMGDLTKMGPLCTPVHAYRPRYPSLLLPKILALCSFDIFLTCTSPGPDCLVVQRSSHFHGSSPDRVFSSCTLRPWGISTPLATRRPTPKKAARELCFFVPPAFSAPHRINVFPSLYQDTTPVGGQPISWYSLRIVRCQNPPNPPNPPQPWPNSILWTLLSFPPFSSAP